MNEWNLGGSDRQCRKNRTKTRYEKKTQHKLADENVAGHLSTLYFTFKNGGNLKKNRWKNSRP